MIGKQVLSTAYGNKMVSTWARHDAVAISHGDPAYSLEHKLAVAFKAGFESGQRHQKKLDKAKELK